MNLRLITPPAEEPVTVADARAHVRQPSSDDDAVLGQLISDARDYVESVTGRSLLAQTWEMQIDDFPRCGRREVLLVRATPLSSISEVRYFDPDGIEQVLNPSIYEAVTGTLPGRIRLRHDEVWPDVRCAPDSVAIKYVAGAASAAGVSPAARRAVFLLLGHWYRHREAVESGIGTRVIELPRGVEMLLRSLYVPQEALVA